MAHLNSNPLAYVGTASYNVNVIGNSFPTGAWFISNERDQFDRMLTAGRNLDEAEPNNVSVQAMGLDGYLAEMRSDNSPRNERVIVSGVITSTADLDFYTFTAAAGEQFAVDIDSAEFQNPLDAALRVYDAAGNLVAWNADAVDR